MSLVPITHAESQWRALCRQYDLDPDTTRWPRLLVEIQDRHEGHPPGYSTAAEILRRMPLIYDPDLSETLADLYGEEGAA